VGALSIADLTNYQINDMQWETSPAQMLMRRQRHAAGARSLHVSYSPDQP
jgi:hypothetical protein